MPPLPRGAVAQWPRCGAVLRRRRVDPVGRSLALALTGLLLFARAVALPFIDINVLGRERETLLLTGPLELRQYGAWELAVAVLGTSVGAPRARLLGLSYVLLGMHLPHPPRHLYAVFRCAEWLRSWSDGRSIPARRVGRLYEVGSNRAGGLGRRSVCACWRNGRYGGGRRRARPRGGVENFGAEGSAGRVDRGARPPLP